MKILQRNFLETSFNAREHSMQNISQNLMASPTSVHNNRYQIINNFKILHTFNNDIFLNSILFLGILHCAAHARPHHICDLYTVSYYTPFRPHPANVSPPHMGEAHLRLHVYKERGKQQRETYNNWDTSTPILCIDYLYACMENMYD